MSKILVDGRYDEKVIEQFASQIENLRKITPDLDKLSSGESSLEFLAGLISGYATSKVLIDNKQEVYIGAFLAFVSNRYIIEKKINKS